MLKTIPTDQLRVGMFLHQLSGSWMDHPFLRSKFLLKLERDVERVREAGIAEAVIDTERGIDTGFSVLTASAELSAAVLEPQPAAVTPAPVAGLDRVGREYADVAQLSTRSMDAALVLFNEVRLGRVIDPERCLPVVEEIVDSVLGAPDALISVARLKTADTYTYMHAVAVCALMVALAKQLGMPVPLIREAGLAGLLLDTGKAQLPQELLDKQGRLSEKETLLVRTHSLRGRQLLAAGSASNVVLDAILQHHERADGTGYPDRLTGDKISLFARMAAVCDVYDATTSRRPYRAAWDPGEAMRQLAQAKGQFDSTVFQSFVKAVGIYPTGSLVRLQSEQLAVVVGQGGASLLTPKVRVFYDVDERHMLQPFELDLGGARCNDKITGVESPDAWRFPDLERLWLGGVKAG